jgi:hypothetical protein
MKKILFVFLLLAGCVFANAQADSTLNAYVGKYTFPDGSPVKEISVAVENGTLMVASAMGNSEFKKTDTKDVFEVVAFGGIATFKRNDEGKVIGVKIEVQEIVLEGTRSEGIAMEQVYLFPLRSVGKLSLQ